MDYFSVIQKSIDFIEEHLYEKLSIHDVASEIGFSVPHFHRIFSIVIGESLKTYIRKRRISNGVIMLKESKFRISDIAFELGFESHEVFIRSFRKIYGVSPKEGKRLECLPLFERIDVMKKKETRERGLINMETKIVVRNSFKIIGRSIKLNQAEQVEDNLIDKFFNKFQHEKVNYPILNNNKIFSMYEYDPECVHENDENINYIYTVGVDFQEDSIIPEGFIIKEIPQSKYALFIHNSIENTLNGVSLNDLEDEGKTITNVYDYIDGVWILNSGYILSDNPDFEIREHNKKGITEYYISIEN